jgi:sugar phosphate isomerase/epimerase
MFARRTGFYGIELGPEHLNATVDELRSQIRGTGVIVSAIVGSLELLNADSSIRKRAIQLDRERLRMAVDLGASGVIEVPVFGASRFPDTSPVISVYELERKLLIAGLKELAGDAERVDVPILLEPLNRYETHFLNRIGQAKDIIGELDSERFRILADFFHMNIEEEFIGSALIEGGTLIGYIHLADTNRLQPGAGHMDFGEGFTALRSIGYDGWLTVESGAKGEMEGAIRQAAELVRKLWKEVGNRNAKAILNKERKA